MGALAWILGAAAIATLGYLLYRMLKRRAEAEQKREEVQREHDQQSREKFQKEQEAQRNRRMQLRKSLQDRLAQEMDTIVTEIEFSKVELKVSRTQVGTKEVETPIPTSDVRVRPMQSLNEITFLLPSEHSYEDGIFYGKLSTNDLLIRTYTGVEAVFESNIVRPEQLMVVLADCSGSMMGQRMSYMVSMMRKLAIRASNSKATTIVIPFTSEPLMEYSERAQSDEEYNTLHDKLPSLARIEGGTDIQKALEAGIDVFRHMQSYEDGKIVLITDGNTGVKEEYVRSQLNEYSLTLHTVCIGEFNASLKSSSSKFIFVELSKGSGMVF